MYFHIVKKLQHLLIPSSVTKIGDLAFQYSGLNRIEIPNSVTKIGKEAFKKCMFLKKVSILSNSVNFGVGVFNKCEALEEISCSSPLKISFLKIYLGIDPKVKISKI